MKTWVLLMLLFDSSSGFDFPNILQEAALDIFPPSSCANYGADFVPQIMLCAGNADASVDTCTVSNDILEISGNICSICSICCICSAEYCIHFT